MIWCSLIRSHMTAAKGNSGWRYVLPQAMISCGTWDVLKFLHINVEGWMDDFQKMMFALKIQHLLEHQADLRV